MKNKFSKIIIFGFVISFLSIFWLGLKKDNSYNTKDLIGGKITNFQLRSIYNSDLITEENGPTTCWNVQKISTVIKDLLIVSTTPLSTVR